MKEVSGSMWTFQMIIIFIFIFTCFLSLVLSYSKAYTIKNRMLTIIEKYEGLTTESGEIISNFASEHSYKTTGKCPSDYYGASDIYGDVTFSESEENQKYYFCFQEQTAANDQKYYNVIVFYKFNLPFIGEIATYKIEGETKTFIGNDDSVIR